MKIERISENQIKFILNREDLIERNIKITELSYGSEKTQELFREMMEQALTEYDFHAENNTPLVIEAIPLSAESIIILVTKTNGSEDIENGFSFMPNNNKQFSKTYRDKFSPKKPVNNKESFDQAMDDELMIYTFDSFNLAAQAASQVKEGFGHINMLYKNDGKYYLVLYNDKNLTAAECAGYDFVLKEFGQRISGISISWAYLVEHGELLIGDDALAVLTALA